MKKILININPFLDNFFESWFSKVLKNSNNLILDPFAGENKIIKNLQTKFDFEFSSFDIHPRSASVKKRDTISSFPKGYKLIVSNPPYLNKEFALKNNFLFPQEATGYPDLVFLCVEKILQNCEYAALILPKFFFKKNEFNSKIIYKKKLIGIIEDDFENEVYLVLFENN